MTKRRCEGCDKMTRFWGRNNKGEVLCGDCIDGDIVNYNVNIGDFLLCIKRQNYCMGQDEDDCIQRGSVVCVDRIEPDGRLGFAEHADRYGFWHKSGFRPLDNNSDL